MTRMQLEEQWRKNRALQSTETLRSELRQMLDPEVIQRGTGSISYMQIASFDELMKRFDELQKKYDQLIDQQDDITRSQ
jgi:hypothetical protein